MRGLISVVDNRAVCAAEQQDAGAVRLVSNGTDVQRGISSARAAIQVCAVKYQMIQVAIITFSAREMDLFTALVIVRPQGCSLVEKQLAAVVASTC